MDLLHGNCDMIDLDEIKIFLIDCHIKKELANANKDNKDTDVLTHTEYEKYPRFV